MGWEIFPPLLFSEFVLDWQDVYKEVYNIPLFFNVFVIFMMSLLLYTC